MKISAIPAFVASSRRCARDRSWHADAAGREIAAQRKLLLEKIESRGATIGTPESAAFSDLKSEPGDLGWRVIVPRGLDKVPFS